MQLTPDFFSRSDNKIHFITLISDKDLTTASNHAQCSTNEKHGAVKYSNQCFTNTFRGSKLEHHRVRKVSKNVDFNNLHCFIRF